MQSNKNSDICILENYLLILDVRDFDLSIYVLIILCYNPHVKRFNEFAYMLKNHSTRNIIALFYL